MTLALAMLSFFTVKVMAWITAALGVAVLALSGLLWAASVRIDDVKNQRDAAELRVTEALNTIEGQKTALAECSARTDALKAEGVKRQAAADEALLRAQTEAGRYEKSNKRLRALQAVSTPSGAGCREAVAEARKGLRK